ncbi:MAG: rod shape-determining protein [Bacilli bacterium]|nr:rod shape-determining protein [Bacilli bacterium]
MDKPIAAIELASKKLKLVVGYEIDGKVYVLYTLVKPYGHAIEAGQFVDPTRVSETIASVREFTDPSAKLKLNISDVLLSLPPYSLGIYQTRQVTTVVTEDSKISNLDIKNIYALIRNSASPLEDKSLVDVIPESFTLDHGRIFARPPIGEASSTLTVSAKVQTLPKDLVEKYQNVLAEGGMVSRRNVVSSLAATELINSFEGMPKSFILVDIGSNITTVSFIGNGALYGSTFFNWGGDNITEKIIECFNINEADAEKYKIMYGIDYREMNFKAPICTTDDGNGQEVHHFNDELNEIIKGELDVFVKDLNDAVNEIVSQHDKSYRNFPMVLIGGGSQLNGLVSYITPKVMSETVQVVAPQTLGARNPTFFNCLGMILTHAKYLNLNDEAHPRVGQVTRNQSK